MVIEIKTRGEALILMKSLLGELRALNSMDDVKTFSDLLMLIAIHKDIENLYARVKDELEKDIEEEENGTQD
jgi:hypothetical protein